MTICMRSKTECPTCVHNDGRYCTLTGKEIEDIIKKWKSGKKSKAKRKLRENESFFQGDTIDKIIEQAKIIENSELRSKEQIDAMNEIDAIFYRWKVIHTEDLFE